MFFFSGAATDREDASAKVTKRKLHNPIGQVCRKGNFKECLLCCRLFVNLSDHVFKTHKIQRSDPSFHHYVTTPVVVPDCYTKVEAGRRVKLAGKELEDAMEEFEETILLQENSLEIMKRLKLSILDLREQIKNSDEDGKEDLHRELAEVQQDYFNYRYPDPRIYSSNVDTWRKSFLLYLESRNTPNPKRIQRMAFDVFLQYEQTCEKTLCFDDVKDAKVIRTMLHQFRKMKTLTNLSKIKYIMQFKLFLEFLFISVDSPETHYRKHKRGDGSEAICYEASGNGNKIGTFHIK